MIRINLLGDNTALDHSGTWFLLGWAMSLVTLVVVLFLLLSSVNTEVEEKTSEKNSLQKQLEQLNEKTKEVNLLEAKKKELADKTTIIATLKRNKVGPVHVLDDLNTAIPERSWLTEIRENSGIMSISGRAIDNQTIAMFMKDLEESNYFEKIDLQESRRVDQAGVSLKEFLLQTKVLYSGKPPKAVDKKEGQAGSTSAASVGDKAVNLSSSPAAATENEGATKVMPTQNNATATEVAAGASSTATPHPTDKELSKEAH